MTIETIAEYSPPEQLEAYISIKFHKDKGSGYAVWELSISEANTLLESLSKAIKESEK